MAEEDHDNSSLRFSQVVCTLDFSFWRTVSTSKLNRWRLETPELPISGALVPLQPPTSGLQQNLDCTTPLTGLGWRIHIEGSAFDAHAEPSNSSRIPQSKEQLTQAFPVQGLFFNSNSAEDFRRIDRQSLIKKVAGPLIDALKTTKEQLQQLSTDLISKGISKKKYTWSDGINAPLLLCNDAERNNLLSWCSSFLILSFADLKSHLYYYNVAVPALRPSKDFKIVTSERLTESRNQEIFLSKAHLVAIGTALLSNPEHYNRGFYSICVLIRRNVNLSSESAKNDWLLKWFSAHFSSSSSSNCPNVIKIDAQNILVPLWQLLVAFRKSKCCDAVSNDAVGNDKYIVRSANAEAVICMVDAFRDDSKPLGHPARSILFSLGYLGLCGGILRFLIFREGTAGLQSLRSSIKKSNDSQLFNPISCILSVQMPSAPAFDLKEAETSQRSFILAGWLRRTLDDPRSDVVSERPKSSASTVTFWVDLRRHMNPIVSQADAVNLNVQLIQWRILPPLDISKLQKLRFLVCGVGTLGCNILRSLAAWGITHFTLVDCGRVALSSPVRQTLFTHEDAVYHNGRGRLKVVAAKRRLLEIRPDLVINAACLDVPMPGHPRYLSTFLQQESNDKLDISSNTKHVSYLHSTINLLQRLVDAHDVVLLLTDTRESRWLLSTLVSTRPLRPNSNLNLKSHSDNSSSYTSSILPPPPFPMTYHGSCETECGSAPPFKHYKEETDNFDDVIKWNELFTSLPTFRSPLCITVALGFDSFVVMRHGQRKLKSDNSLDPSSPLACYFCNDLTAPADSLTRRPLDQQCTVTRPGVSGIAANIAAELIAALSQHPDAPDPPHCSKDFGPNDQSRSCLGSTPHTVRGSLVDFRLVCAETEAFKHCISCSVPIITAYCSDNQTNFIINALHKSESLEMISGLAAMKLCHREEEIVKFEDDVVLID